MNRTVTYRRGAESLSVNATVGRFLFKSTDSAGVTVYEETRDYLIRAVELTTLGEPARGDEIVETVGGIEQLFRVHAPDGEPVFRYSDTERLVMRIHTQHMGVET